MIKTIVIGSLNTDIVASGIEKFPDSGELVYAKSLLIGPGGKSRNVAQMIAELSPPGAVAMIGITAKDKYGLWQPPLDSLKKAGVNVDSVTITEDTDKLPGVALIPVNQQGQNQIIVIPGISDDLLIEHIDEADSIFDEVAKNNGFLALTLELSPKIADHAIKKANSLGIKVLLDPGGIEQSSDLNAFAKDDIFLLKPNEHEAEVLSGVTVSDVESASKAAKGIFNSMSGLKNLLITDGANGAYLFEDDVEVAHLLIPEVDYKGTKDATGAGDQTFAGIVSKLQSGLSLNRACEFGVRVGTMQFNRPGIDPIKNQDLI